MSVNYKVKKYRWQVTYRAGDQRLANGTKVKGRILGADYFFTKKDALNDAKGHNGTVKKMTGNLWGTVEKKRKK